MSLQYDTQCIMYQAAHIVWHVLMQQLAWPLEFAEDMSCSEPTIAVAQIRTIAHAGKHARVCIWQLHTLALSIAACQL